MCLNIYCIHRCDMGRRGKITENIPNVSINFKTFFSLSIVVCHKIHQRQVSQNQTTDKTVARSTCDQLKPHSASVWCWKLQTHAQCARPTPVRIAFAIVHTVRAQTQHRCAWHSFKTFHFWTHTFSWFFETIADTWSSGISVVFDLI